MNDRNAFDWIESNRIELIHDCGRDVCGQLSNDISFRCTFFSGRKRAKSIAFHNTEWNRNDWDKEEKNVLRHQLKPRNPIFLLALCLIYSKNSMCVFFACFSVEIMHSINVRKFSKNWNFALTETDNPLFDVLLKMTAYNGNVRHFYAAAAVVRVFEWSTPFWNVEFLFLLFSFSFLFFSVCRMNSKSFVCATAFLLLLLYSVRLDCNHRISCTAHTSTIYRSL